MCRDSLTGDPLGRAFPVNESVTKRIAMRVAALGMGLGVAERAEAFAAIEVEEEAAGARRAVAGYDRTFSIPKSASALWAVADAATQVTIAHVHHAAVADVIALMERGVAATRAGATPGDGAVAQLDATGLIAAAFNHSEASQVLCRSYAGCGSRVRAA